MKLTTNEVVLADGRGNGAAVVVTDTKDMVVIVGNRLEGMDEVSRGVGAYVF